YIDDAFIGKTPMNTEILAGIHKFKIQAPFAFEGYEKSIDFNLEKEEINITLTPSAELLIPEAEKLIDLNRRFKPVDAEYELIKAKNSFSNKDYVPAYESALNATKWAKDVDGDGIANEWDIFPNLANDIIYKISLIIILIIGIVVLIDKHFCKVNPQLKINIVEDPFEKRKFKLHVFVHFDRKIKSMSCSILLDDNSIEVFDAPGDYIIELGQLKTGFHEVRVELSIIQKRYGKVSLNEIQEIDTDKRWFKKE
ncbi:MAG: PEGA domain-containing protein, partial [Methanoregula sp.]|nr:PEGA domain-containing protein [Methanoregula sp.]